MGGARESILFPNDENEHTFSSVRAKWKFTFFFFFFVKFFPPPVSPVCRHLLLIDGGLIFFLFCFKRKKTDTFVNEIRLIVHILLSPYKVKPKEKEQ